MEMPETRAAVLGRSDGGADGVRRNAAKAARAVEHDDRVLH
ncbi:hypothetical protein ACP4OV_015304 [Aristida adscensionis]